MGRESVWSHRHTTSMIKLFWSQHMSPWASAAAYGQSEKFTARPTTGVNSEQAAVVYGPGKELVSLPRYEYDKAFWSQLLASWALEAAYG